MTTEIIDENKDFAKTLLVRHANKGDIGFIMSSWLRSFRDGDMVEGVPNQVYYYQHHKVLESILSRATTVVLCLPDSPDVIFAWFCFEAVENGLVGHYIYTKDTFRRAGLAKKLYDYVISEELPAQVFATHRVNPMGREFKKKNVLYNPFLLFKELS